MLGMCASFRIWFLITVQNLACSTQFLRKICVWKIWEEELVNGRHAVLLYGDSVRWTVCAETLTGYRWYVWTTEHMCASFHSRVRSAEWTRHKLGRRDRNFIYAINWVNLLVLMALSATSRTKRSCSCVKKMLGSSPAKSMNVLAQTDFCSQLPDAASCTKITTTNIIQMGRVQIRF